MMLMPPIYRFFLLIYRLLLNNQFTNHYNGLEYEDVIIPERLSENRAESTGLDARNLLATQGCRLCRGRIAMRAVGCDA